MQIVWYIEARWSFIIIVLGNEIFFNHPLASSVEDKNSGALVLVSGESIQVESGSDHNYQAYGDVKVTVGSMSDTSTPHSIEHYGRHGIQQRRQQHGSQLWNQDGHVERDGEDSGTLILASGVSSYYGESGTIEVKSGSWKHQEAAATSQLACGIIRYIYNRSIEPS